MFFGVLFLPALAASAQQAPAAQPLDIGSRLELFVDGYLIDAMRGLSLKLHSPQPAGTAISFDKPWEGNVSAYVTVINDGNRYRMYYRGSADPRYIRRSALKPGEPEIPPHPEFTCYAESRDGIHWSKPSLELFKFNGSKENNILWVGPEAHNFAPFIDGNPAAHASARYKAVGRRQKGLTAFQSADGLHWTRIQEAPVITDGAFDSLNVAFWDSIRNHYVAIYPLLVKGAKLLLNCATSAAGSIRFEIQDAAGKPLPGLALDNSPLLWGDRIEQVIPLPIPAGFPIRLRFVMKDADLYSIQFRE
jgi:hypothetical protein